MARYGGRLWHDTGDRPYNREQHLDHGYQPAGQRQRERESDDAARDVGHFAGRSVHLRGRADGLGADPDRRFAVRWGTMVSIIGNHFTGATTVVLGSTLATN